MEIILKNLQKKVPIPRLRILKAVKAAFRKLEKNRDVSYFFKEIGRRPYFSIVFVGTKRMRAINKKYLKHDYATDVLSFDLGEGFGEIIICPQIAYTNAKAHQTSTEKEIVLYVMHGILHLSGFDDHKYEDTIQMRRMEKELTSA
jgi:probable rRNA maturation factor